MIIPKLGAFVRKLMLTNNYNDSSFTIMIKMTLVQLINFIEHNEL